MKAVGKAQQQVGYMFRDQLQKEASESLKSSIEKLYTTTTELKDIQQKKVRDEILQFGDVILEYKNTILGIKVGGSGQCGSDLIVIVVLLQRLMNRRTDALIAYAEAVKNRESKQENVEKLRQKLAEGSAELALFMEELEKVSDKPRGSGRGSGGDCVVSTTISLVSPDAAGQGSGGREETSV